MKPPRSRRKGQTILEFTFAAIPMIFLLISVEEISRGMYIYTTLAHAIKEGTRYSIVHGADCAQADTSCPVTLGQVATHIKQAGVGLDTSQLSVVLKTATSTQNCAPIKTCLTNATQWPPSPDNGIGLPVTVSGTYPFNSAISMFLPQGGAVKFGSMNFGAASEGEIQY
ncbi:MAG TPA: TadE family protein [Bryobacteraceae bacterium]|jgi:Flp pilus assembly protein TadG